MTNAELAVLSLIVERPRHAYEIEQVIVDRGMRDWTDVGFSSIYYLLRKMETAGLVASQRAESVGRGPGRTVYSPTPAGRGAWTAASLEALATPEMKMPFLLGLTGLGGLPEDRRLKAVRACLTSLDDRLCSVIAKRCEKGDAEWFVDEVFDYSEESLRFARDWVAGLVERLERRDGGGSGGREDEAVRTGDRRDT